MSTTITSVRVNYPTIKVTGCPGPGEARWTLSCAQDFHADYPDRVGRRHGCVYSHGALCCYTYRLKSGTVVAVWQDKTGERA